MHGLYSKVENEKKTRNTQKIKKRKSTHKSVLSRREVRRRPTFWKIRRPGGWRRADRGWRWTSYTVRECCTSPKSVPFCSCYTLEIHRRWKVIRFAIGGCRKPDGDRAGSPWWCVAHSRPRLMVSTSATPAKVQKTVKKMQQGRRSSEKEWQGRSKNAWMPSINRSSMAKGGAMEGKTVAGARGTVGDVQTQPKTPRVL
jgi:hypothetical protein